MQDAKKSKTVFDRFSMKNSRMKTKIFLVIAMPLILTMSIGVIATINLNRLSNSQEWVAHTQHVLENADHIVASAVSMESGLRGYLLAGTDTFLEPYHAGETSAYETLASLRETVSDNPLQVARLQQAEDVLRQWQAEVAEEEIALRAAIGDALTMNDLADVVGQREGLAYFDAFRELIAEFSGIERGLLEDRVAALNRALANGLASSSDVAESLQWVEHTYDVIGVSEQILSAAVDMENGLRGFLLAGDDAFLEPLNEGWERFSRLSTELAETVSDNPAQVQRLLEIQSLIGDWHLQIVEPMLQLRRQIGDAATMDDMADRVGEGRGAVHINEFRAIMDEFSGIESGLMEEREATASTLRNQTMLQINGAVILSVLLGGLLAWIMGNTIAAAIQRVTVSMRKLADGDVSAEVSGQDRRDEVGEMARALGVFRDALNEKEQLQEAQRKADEAQHLRDAERNEVMKDISGRLSQLAKGDLTVLINREFPEGYQQLRTDFNATVSTLSEAIQQVVISTESIRNGADELSKASDDLAVRTEAQAATLEESAAALEQLTSSVKSSAEGARDAERTTNEARKKVESSSAVVSRTIEAMTEIERSSSQITTIVSVIDDIAFQTNLLALNAGVEAARAGDAGRGFAVVASEVRGLAQRCADSAREIKSLISQSSEQVKRGVALVGETGIALEDIVGRVNHISELVATIASATKEQSNGLGEINTGVVELDQLAQKNAAMVEEATAAIHALNEDARGLAESVSKFSLLNSGSGFASVSSTGMDARRTRRVA